MCNDLKGMNFKPMPGHVRHTFTGMTIRFTGDFWHLSPTLNQMR